MGLISDLFGGLLKCLCGGIKPDSEQRPGQQEDFYAPPTLTHKPAVSQQPAPLYPPTQPYPQSQSYSQPQQPTYAEQAHRPPHAEQSHEPTHEHKKHKKHGQSHGGQHSESGGFAQAHTAHTPGPASPPPPPSSPPSRPWSPGRPDPNQVNQHNEHYVDLRARANAAGDEMARNFEAAHQAYENKDGARAKELSNAGKAAQREMERLNEEAAEWIFKANNTDSQPGEVDLHGLYVKEAIRYTDQSIREAQARGESKIRFIVGKGLHSTNHVAKIKPAIEELIQKHGLVAELDEHNSGVLIVNLDGQTSGRGPVMSADELTRGLQKKDECIVM